MPFFRWVLGFCIVLVVLASGCVQTVDEPLPEPTPAPTPTPTPTPGWNTIYRETFEDNEFEGPAEAPLWVADTFADEDRFSDGGEYFQNMSVVPPVAYRAESTFGKDDWLTVAAYSRTSSLEFDQFFDVVADPADPSNRVLRLQSPLHTNGVVVRPTHTLPAKYRVCLKVGHAEFGSGKSDPSDLNGYFGGERSEPWFNDDSTKENGFYWLTILDSVPRPRNNVWIHHHRKVVIDSDNNKDAWTEIWTGSEFAFSGEHPVMVFAVDQNGFAHDRIGKPFLSYSAGVVQPSGYVRAVDAYRDNTWYSACIERNETSFVLTVSGDFKYGGNRTYTATFPLSAAHNALTTPDYFMFGDPHNNYYRGRVFYDDLELHGWVE